MKYKNLLPFELYEKLLNCRFSSANVNRNIFDVTMAVQDCYIFMQNEIAKTNNFNAETKTEEERAETIEASRKYIESLLEMEITPALPKLILTEDNFTDENCEYSNNKKFWLSGGEINLILDWCKNN